MIRFIVRMVSSPENTILGRILRGVLGVGLSKCMIPQQESHSARPLRMDGGMKGKASMLKGEEAGAAQFVKRRGKFDAVT